MRKLLLHVCLDVCLGIQLRHEILSQQNTPDLTPVFSPIENGTYAVAYDDHETAKDVVDAFLKHYRRPRFIFSMHDAISGSFKSKTLMYFVGYRENLLEKLTAIRTSKSWDYRGRIVIFICAKVENTEWLNQVLEDIWKIDVLNFAVVYFQENIGIASYNPFGEEKHLNLTAARDYFPDKLKNLNGHRFDVGIPDIPPLTRSRNGRIFGKDVTVFKMIMSVINAEVDLRNSTLDASPDDEMVFHSGVIKANNLDNLSILYPYKMDNVVIVVPKGNALPRYRNMHQMFTGTLWSLILISLIAVTVLSTGVTFAIKRKHPSITKLWLQVVQLLVSSSTVIKLNLRAVQVILIFWAYLCLILTTAFNSMLTSILVAPVDYQEINTIDALVRTNLGVKFDLYFADDVQREFVGRGMKGIINKTIKYEVLKSLYTGDVSFAYVLPSGAVTDGRFPRANGNPMFHVMRQYLLPTLRAYVCKGKCVCLEKMNEVLLRLYENGFVGRVESSLKLQKYYRKADFSKVVVLNVSHFQFAFLLLGLGFVVSTFALFCELARFYYKRANLVVVICPAKKV